MGGFVILRFLKSLLYRTVPEDPKPQDIICRIRNTDGILCKIRWFKG